MIGIPKLTDLIRVAITSPLLKRLVGGDGVPQRKMDKHHRHDGPTRGPGLPRLMHQRHGAVEPRQGGLQVAGLDVQPCGLGQVLARLLSTVLADERVGRLLPQSGRGLGILK